MTGLQRREWVPEACESLIQAVAAETAAGGAEAARSAVERLALQNRHIHEAECLNLNPGTNAMSPRAEAVMAAGLGSRPSLGYPGDKYEMGLEAIERIEVIAAELAAQVFGARYAEVRVGSGALANLYCFMAVCRPGDAVIVPPATVAGHVTHHADGAAGLYGLQVHPAPVDADGYEVDLLALADLARRVRPRLITIGGSLNLFPHPVSALKAIADEVGARLLYDAAHVSGMIAGGAWQHPLAEGADLMTMSTYKSLAGPPSGLILTDDPELAARIDRIAYPGLTANFDAGRVAALAITLADWLEFGAAYAGAMRATAAALADALEQEGLPLYRTPRGVTASHQFALKAAGLAGGGGGAGGGVGGGGGQAAARRLRRANLLACGIGLPLAEVPGDVNGLRLGANELARWGMGPAEMPLLAGLIARALTHKPEDVATEVTSLRGQFRTLHFAG